MFLGIATGLITPSDIHLSARLALPPGSTYVSAVSARLRTSVETTVALISIQQLMREHQAELLRERRAADRKPFVRPVLVATGRNHHVGFSRDISILGIGMVTRTEWAIGTHANLTIHSLTKREVCVNAELRWCQPYGEGWYLSGWKFLPEDA